MAHRPSQQTIESDVFAGPDHKNLRVSSPRVPSRMPPRAGSPVEDTFHQTGEARLESASGFGPSGDARGWRSTPPITAGTKVPMIDDQ